jgi:germacradienol/geosmin synthase
VPDPVDYIEMRRKTGGTEFSSTLAQYALGDGIPPEIYRSRPMRALVHTFADVGPLRNDIFSYRKELEHEGEINNGVLVVQRFFNCEPQQAVAIVNDLTTSRLRQFESIVADELPALFDEFALDASARGRLAAYAKGLQEWMAGDLRWSQGTGRYRQAGSPLAPVAARLAGGPTGLGTSAARIGSLAPVS